MDAGDTLRELLANELTNAPLDSWGYYFPATVAIWKFVESIRPDVLGTFIGGYDTEPFYSGRGADWFLDVLLPDDLILDSVDMIMRSATDALPQGAIDRGFLLQSEKPTVDAETAAKIASRTTELLATAGATTTTK